MNTFISNLKKRIEKADDTSMYTINMDILSDTELIYPTLNEPDTKKLLTKNIIIHWVDRQGKLINLYNIHEDYIKLILKLSFKGSRNTPYFYKVIK